MLHARSPCRSAIRARGRQRRRAPNSMNRFAATRLRERAWNGCRRSAPIRSRGATAASTAVTRIRVLPASVPGVIAEDREVLARIRRTWRLENRRRRDRNSWIMQVLISRTRSVCGLAPSEDSAQSRGSFFLVNPRLSIFSSFKPVGCCWLWRPYLGGSQGQFQGQFDGRARVDLCQILTISATTFSLDMRADPG